MQSRVVNLGHFEIEYTLRLLEVPHLLVSYDTFEKTYPFSSQGFQRDKTAGVSSRSWTVTNVSKSVTKIVACRIVCLDPFAVITGVGCLV